MLFNGLYCSPQINPKPKRKGFLIAEYMLCLFVLVQSVGFLCMEGIKGSCTNWCQNEILEIMCVLRGL